MDALRFFGSALPATFALIPTLPSPPHRSLSAAVLPLPLPSTGTTCTILSFSASFTLRLGLPSGWSCQAVSPQQRAVAFSLLPTPGSGGAPQLGYGSLGTGLAVAFDVMPALPSSNRVGIYVNGSLSYAVTAPLPVDLANPSVSLSVRVGYESATQILSVSVGSQATPILAAVVDLCSELGLNGSAPNPQISVGFVAGAVGGSAGGGQIPNYIGNVNIVTSEYGLVQGTNLHTVDTLTGAEQSMFSVTVGHTVSQMIEPIASLCACRHPTTVHQVSTWYVSIANLCS